MVPRIRSDATCNAPRSTTDRITNRFFITISNLTPRIQYTELIFAIKSQRLTDPRIRGVRRSYIAVDKIVLLALSGDVEVRSRVRLAINNLKRIRCGFTSHEIIHKVHVMIDWKKYFN